MGNHGARLAVLLSGGGTTLQNLIDHIGGGRLDARVDLVLSSRADAYGLERARQHGIRAVAVPRSRFANAEAFNDALHAEIGKQDLDLIVLAGFMSLFRVPEKWRNRVMNIHPALIPSFCGQGYYGSRVHQAVLDFGAKVSGATVHFVDAEYDHGPIILQGCVPVEEDDTAETLAARVHGLENRLYVEAIQLFAEGRLRVEGRRTRILPKGGSSLTEK